MPRRSRQRPSGAALGALLLVLLLGVAAPAGAWARSAATGPAARPGPSAGPLDAIDFTNSTIDYNSSVDGYPLSYTEILPDDFSPAATYPLAIELHGIAPTETTSLPGGYPTIVNNDTADAAVDHGFLLIIPNTRTGTGFYVNSEYTGPQAQDVLDAIAHERALRHVGKLYLYGFSMGSFGALSIGLNHPGMFAALGAIAAFSDDFELVEHLIAINSTGLIEAGLDITGGTWPNASAYARGLFAELSPLRYYPTNASGTPIYLASGGDDVLSTNNPAFSPYEQANDTVLQTTCLVATDLGEPASCTVPLAELAALDPANYSYRYVYEPNGFHDYGLLNATDMFSYFTGSAPDGTYWGAYPVPTPGPPPTPLLTLVTYPIDCGTIGFQGMEFPSGVTLGPAPGVYNLSFQPCPGTTLQRVVPLGAMIYNPADALLTVRGSGALVAYFESPPAQFDVQFRSNVACDAVVVNGTAEAPVSAELLAPGVYPLLAQGCGNSQFRNWTTNGAVSVTNASASVTELIVHGNGTLTATYAAGPPPPVYALLTVMVSPSTCGPIGVGAMLVGSGTTLQLPIGPYNLSAPSCPAFEFFGWSVSAGIVVVGSGPTTSATLSNSASLTAIYAPGVAGIFSVEVQVDPGSCGNAVAISGVEYGNLTDALLPAGSYSLTAETCRSMTFSSWLASGGLTTSGANLIVSGNGTLTAQYTPSSSPPGGEGGASPNGTGSGTSAWLWAGAGALAGGAAVGVAALLSRRRPRPPPAEPFDEAP